MSELSEAIKVLKDLASPNMPITVDLWRAKEVGAIENIRPQGLENTSQCLLPPNY